MDPRRVWMHCAAFSSRASCALVEPAKMGFVFLVLLAVMAGAYGVYHGPEGLMDIAEEIHRKTATLNEAVKGMGLTNAMYLDMHCFFFSPLHFNQAAQASFRFSLTKAEGFAT